MYDVCVGGIFIIYILKGKKRAGALVLYYDAVNLILFLFVCKLKMYINIAVRSICERMVCCI